ncbi:Rv3235 family protein [Demequina iriomotensis]|uniref:Rv3235 family protein n=1 Tax=Demequina iriomotensis TaxID=1536641 RepID=UPI0007852DFD|nr:Rv3235 family protein [Demequina iriomotensis]
MSAEPIWAPRPPRPDVYGRRRATLGDPTPLACTSALTAIEVVHGGDGLESLRRWITPEVRERLARQHSLARRLGRRGGVPATILRARACRVSPTATEIAAVAAIGDRVHAVAIRLEDLAGRWVITVLDIG